MISDDMPMPGIVIPEMGLLKLRNSLQKHQYTGGDQLFDCLKND